MSSRQPPRPRRQPPRQRRPGWLVPALGAAFILVVAVALVVMRPSGVDPGGGVRANVKGAADAPVTVEEWVDIQ